MKISDPDFDQLALLLLSGLSGEAATASGEAATANLVAALAALEVSVQRGTCVYVVAFAFRAFHV
jgi:hypothetical protein